MHIFCNKSHSLLPDDLSLLEYVHRCSTIRACKFSENTSIQHLIFVCLHDCLRLNVLLHTYHRMDHINIHPSSPIFPPSSAWPQGRSPKRWPVHLMLQSLITSPPSHLRRFIWHIISHNQNFKAFRSYTSHRYDSDQRLACCVWLPEHEMINCRLASI